MRIRHLESSPTREYDFEVLRKAFCVKVFVHKLILLSECQKFCVRTFFRNPYHSLEVVQIYDITA